MLVILKLRSSPDDLSVQSSTAVARSCSRFLRVAYTVSWSSAVCLCSKCTAVSWLSFFCSLMRLSTQCPPTSICPLLLQSAALCLSLSVSFLVSLTFSSVSSSLSLCLHFWSSLHWLSLVVISWFSFLPPRLTSLDIMLPLHSPSSSVTKSQDQDKREEAYLARSLSCWVAARRVAPGRRKCLAARELHAERHGRRRLCIQVDLLCHPLK